MGLSAQITKPIRDVTLSGDLIVDERLPSEVELAIQFGVSRPAIREAHKRLAAQFLILSMNRVSLDTACKAHAVLPALRLHQGDSARHPIALR